MVITGLGTYSGSIPAPAGEPSELVNQWTKPGTTLGGLSPRLRGNRTGTSGRPSGLSPRLRGNRAQQTTPWEYAWVYPRACGGTLGKLVVRSRTGSIPAPAGEPPGEAPTIYPRACGGTRKAQVRGNCSQPPPWGLSPRLRGNHMRQAGGTRSIPAPAGEPGVDFRLHQPGLSPRLRGNLVPAGSGPSRLNGSIPAPAGEPSGTTPSNAHRIGVYPRACGGTILQRPGTAIGSIPAPAGEPVTIQRSPAPGSIPAPAGEP